MRERGRVRERERERDGKSILGIDERAHTLSQIKGTNDGISGTVKNQLDK